MGHKVKVDGVDYQVVKGKCNVGGVGYNIFEGKTKITGTGYGVFLKNLRLVATDYSASLGFYSDDYGMTWNQMTTSAYGYSKNVVFGKNRFASIFGSADNSQVLTSADGISWVVASGVTHPLNLTFGNGVFICTGYYGASYGYKSTDGITWTTLSVMPPHMGPMCYGNGKFVSVGLSGIDYSSDNGETWNTGTGSFNCNAVVYGGDRFVAVGNNSTTPMYYSLDGIAWAAIAGAPTQAWAFVTYGNGKFVAVDHGGRNAYSTDGITWHLNTNLSFYIDSVVYTGRCFVCVGTKAAYSTDGISWTEVTVTGATHLQAVGCGRI
jgi:hypothetical protein